MWRHSYRELEKTIPSLISRSHWRLHTPSYLALIVSKASISLGTKGLVPRLRPSQQGTITGEELGNMQCLTQGAGQTVSGIYKLNTLVVMVTVTYEKTTQKKHAIHVYIYYNQGLVNPRPENQDQWNGRETWWWTVDIHTKVKTCW